MNPFGAAITNATLTPMRRYRGKTITQEDRAREAMKLIQASNKNLDVLKHVLNLKSEYGNGVSTLVMVYNATGGTLEFVEDQQMDWFGSVYKEEPPRTFENGQWVGFLHVHPTGRDLGSEAARVIRGSDIHGHVRDFLISWFAPWHNSPENSAYTEIGERDEFPQDWNQIKANKLENANKITRHESDQNMESTISIGGLTTSECIAILKHKFRP